MNIHEYQAKAILARYGIPLPESDVAETADAAAALASRIAGSRWAVKAQVLAGGRGRAGGVRLVDSPEAAGSAAQSLLGQRLVTARTGPEGRVVRRVSVERVIDHDRSLYVAALIDRASASVALIGARHGGEDIEERAARDAGLIEQEVRLPDGRFNLQLRGVTRVEIRDFVQDSPYRVATVRVLDDQNENGGEEVEGEKRRLLASCASLLQEISGAGQHPMALDTGVPFALIVNTLCQTLALDPTAKQQLLEQNDLLLRCRSLIDILDRRWQEIALRHVDQDGSTGEVH